MGLICRVDPELPEPHAIDLAVETLRRGGLVAFPTETVYGLGAAADHEGGARRLAEVKRRPPDKPFTLLIADGSQALEWASHSSALDLLARRFWPGPMTIVAPSRGGGQPVGLRVPAHPVALALVRSLGCPILAPSANRSGEPPCVDAQSVARSLGDDVDLILDGGRAPGGRPSTVVELTAEAVRIVREGPISGADIAALGISVQTTTARQGRTDGLRRSSGAT